MKPKTLDLSKLTLYIGNHLPDSTYCVMELSAYVAGEPWSDHPECVSPIIAAFLRSWNDSLNNTDRQMLKPYAVKAIGTRTTNADEVTRMWMATDWLVKVCTPKFLDLVPALNAHAAALRVLDPLVDASSARKALPTIAGARRAAGAAEAAEAAGAAWAAEAAGEKLRLTVEELQQSALHLLDRMIDVGKTDVKLAVTVTGL